MPPKRAVRLAVLMPSGYVVTDSFPRLAWRHTAAGEEGTALLPAAPAFVSVSLEHSEAAGARPLAGRPGPRRDRRCRHRRG